MPASHPLTKDLNISTVSTYATRLGRTPSFGSASSKLAKHVKRAAFCNRPIVLSGSHAICVVQKGQRKPCAAFPTNQQLRLAAKGGVARLFWNVHNMHHPAAFFYQKLLLRHAEQICWVLKAREWSSSTRSTRRAPGIYCLPCSYPISSLALSPLLRLWTEPHGTSSSLLLH